VIKDCSVCANYDGIFLNSVSATNNTVIACSVSKNSINGVSVGIYSNVRDCVIDNNGAAGLSAGSFSTISGCIVSGNGASGIDAASSIRVKVTDCTADSNGGYGINVSGDSMITGCHASANGGVSAHAAGINTLNGSGSRVDGNQVRDNYGYGIQAGTGDVVIRNFAGSNSTNFLTTSGANFGPIETPSAMTNALGNIAY